MMLGVVLAGGASSRMGTPKALVDVAGRTMLERVAGAVAATADRLVVAGGAKAFSGFDTLPDPLEGPMGPLAGLVAGLGEAGRTGAPAILVVAVDHPFVRRSTLQRLVKLWKSPAVIPESDGVRQVTCGVYPAAMYLEAADELASGGSIQSLLDRIPHRIVAPAEWSTWGENGASWFSVDDPAAMAAGLDRFGSTLE